MGTRGKVMDGKEVFYTKLTVYLHIYKHKSFENLEGIFGVARSTMLGWVKEFNQSRLESILKNFNLEAAPEAEGTGDCDLQKIRKLLVRQAEGGSTTATKLLLDLEKEEQVEKDEDQGLTVERAVELLHQWHAPRVCSKCGHEDKFLYHKGYNPCSF